MYYNFPFKIDGLGHTAQVDYETHIRQMIEQLLFTEIGERVNRPSFGTGITSLIFSPNREELSASVNYIIQGALQQWLGDLTQVTEVMTKSEESSLYISISYIIRRNQDVKKVQFVKGI